MAARLTAFIIYFFLYFFCIGAPVFNSEKDTGKTFNKNEVEYFLNLPEYENISKSLVNTFLKKISAFADRSSKNIVTLIDFSLPSTAKRMWTINLDDGCLLFHTLVAHGKNTGDNVARYFSNKPQSYQSSLGFYMTGNTYIGKHGNSLKLHGLEKNVNDKAEERAIVIHGADYVSDDFIRRYGRLGRSHGCPAIPYEITDEFINTAKEGSLVFIYHPNYK